MSQRNIEILRFSKQKNRPLMQGCRSLVPIVVLFLCFIFDSSSMWAQTKVIVEGGASMQVRVDLADRVESILSGINAWHEGNPAQLENEVAGNELIQIIANQKLISRFDTLSTEVYTYLDQYEVPNLTLLPQDGDPFDFQDLVLTFNTEYQLTGARLASKNRSIDRILSRNIAVDDQEFATSLALLDAFKQAFEQKSSEQFRTLFAEDPLIVSGARSQQFDGFELRRSEATNYFQRLQERTFVPGNEISIEFADVVVRRHPDVGGFYGISAKQNYNSTSYSDLGFIFIVADLSNPDAPKIVTRKWQDTPFKTKEFSVQTPDPIGTKLGLEEVIPDVASIIEIRIRGEAAEALTPERLIQFLTDGTLRFEGIQIEKNSIAATEQGVEVRFSTSEDKVTFPTGIILRENNVLLGFEGQTTVYRNHRNVLSINAKEEPVSYVEEILSGEVILTFNTDSVQVHISDSLGNTQWKTLQTEREAVFGLVRGSYTMSFSRSGYFDSTSTAAITAGKVTMIEIGLRPIPPPEPEIIAEPEPVEEKRQKFFVSRRYLIYGAVAVVATGAYLALRPGEEEFLPIPPGRPVPAKR